MWHHKVPKSLILPVSIEELPLPTGGESEGLALRVTLLPPCTKLMEGLPELTNIPWSDGLKTKAWTHPLHHYTCDVVGQQQTNITKTHR